MSSGYGRVTKVAGGIDLQHTAAFQGFKTAEKTGDYTVLDTDSGTWFVANAAAAVVNFTLPAPGETTNKGHFWIFQDIGAGGMGIVANANLVVINNAAATSVLYTTANQKIGAVCAVFCDGTEFFLWELGTSTQTIA